MTNIGFLTSGWTPTPEGIPPIVTGASLYRCLLPAMKLHENLGYNTIVAGGAHLTVDGIEIIGWDDHVYSDFDIVVFQEWLHKDIIDMIDCAHAAGTKIVLDCDDLLWGVDPKHVAYEHLKHNPDNARNTAHWQKALTMADAVTCATQFLYDEIKSKFNDNVYLLRNSPEYRYFPYKSQRHNPVRVGWAGGLPWRSGDLEKLNGIMLPYLQKHDYRFQHVGYIPSWGSIHSRLGIPRRLLDESGICDITQYPFQLTAIDIGVVPLKYCAFNEAKSSLKGMEYTAAGIPFVTHYTEEYKWFNAGIIARTKKEFVEGLERLSDLDEWHKVRAQAFERLKEVCIDVTWPLWDQVYQSLLLNIPGG